MNKFPAPFIERVPYNGDFETALATAHGERDESDRDDWVRHQLRFPTVYVIRSRRKVKYGSRYTVYVGETNDIKKRTRQHLYQDPRGRDDWKELAKNPDVEMYVIGHPYFNKSLTLDLENRFLHYLEACQSVEHHNNRRTNEQREYFTLDHLDPIFEMVWDELRGIEPELFDDREAIQTSAIFKASPFHKLSEEQLDAQNRIFEAVNAALEARSEGGTESENKLIIVSGEAGSGKTVLISSVFNGLVSGVRDEDERFRKLAAGPDGERAPVDAYLISGHKNEGGQYAVYEEIIRKLGIPAPEGADRKRNRVYKPTAFINSFSPDKPADVVLIDEAHLLLTQKSLGYFYDKPQIEAILDRAKVVIAVYDAKQVLETPQHWETPLEEHFQHRLAEPPIRLGSQLRLNAGDATVEWIRNLVDPGIITEIPVDPEGYDLRIFENPADLEKAIRRKDSQVENSLARVIATFDWKYSSQHKNAEEDDGLWYVDVHHPTKQIRMPWNLQLSRGNRERRIAYRRAWSETPETINEVGSTYTIQGFDLNYSGVILGPSITYRDGRIVIDPSKSAHAKAVQRRQMADGSKVSFGEQLIKNELNVLLTRGTKGMYIYAQDEELRNALLDAQRSASEH